MKVPYDDGLKFLVLSAILIGLALFFNQGQAPPRAEPAFPIANMLLIAGLGCGVLGFINLIRANLSNH